MNILKKTFILIFLLFFSESLLAATLPTIEDFWIKTGTLYENQSNGFDAQFKLKNSTSNAVPLGKVALSIHKDDAAKTFVKDMKIFYNVTISKNSISSTGIIYTTTPSAGNYLIIAKMDEKGNNQWTTLGTLKISVASVPLPTIQDFWIKTGTLYENQPNGFDSQFKLKNSTSVSTFLGNLALSIHKDDAAKSWVRDMKLASNVTISANGIWDTGKVFWNTAAAGNYLVIAKMDVKGNGQWTTLETKKISVVPVALPSIKEFWIKTDTIYENQASGFDAQFKLTSNSAASITLGKVALSIHKDDASKSLVGDMKLTNNITITANGVWETGKVFWNTAAAGNYLVIAKMDVKGNDQWTILETKKINVAPIALPSIKEFWIKTDTIYENQTSGFDAQFKLASNSGVSITLGKVALSIHKDDAAKSWIRDMKLANNVTIAANRIWETGKVFWDTADAGNYLVIAKMDVKGNDQWTILETKKISVVVAPTGSIQGDIQPSAISGQAIFEILSSKMSYGTYKSGKEITSFISDTYTINFKDILGWKKPNDKNIAVIAGKKTTFQGIYSNNAPKVEISTDNLIVRSGDNITLMATATDDNDSTSNLIYQWKQTTDASIDFSNKKDSNVIFEAPIIENEKTFIFKVTVTDRAGFSSSDDITITVKPSNKPPIANATSDKEEANSGDTVELNGSASYDPEKSSLLYKWEQSDGSGVIVSLSEVSSIKPSFVVPEVDAETTLSFTLIVNDGELDSESTTVSIVARPAEVKNEPPIANAGEYEPVESGQTLQLDGSASSDLEDKPMAYLWTVTDGKLDDESSMTPIFTAPSVDAETIITVILKVTDDKGESHEDTVSITVTPTNKPPIANAGEDKPVESGQTLQLDGSASSDPEDKPMAYLWTITAGELDDESNITPIFTAPSVDAETIISATLKVTDDKGESHEDTVSITVTPNNKPPVANAGEDKPVKSGATVQLDGSASSDPDGTLKTYEWTAPQGDVTLDDTSSINPSFIAPNVDTETSLTFTLKVTDDKDASDEATVTITVKPTNKPPVAQELSESTEEDTEKSIVLIGEDPEQAALTYEIVSQPEHGSLSEPNESGELTYTPEENYFGEDSFSFKVNDGELDSESATVNLSVTSINDAPVATEQNYVELDEDNVLPIILEGSDVEDDSLTYTVIDKPTHGTVSEVTETGEISYSPAADFYGQDSFTFTVNDGESDSDTVMVSLIVNPINDAPTATAQTVETTINGNKEIILAGKDMEDNEKLIYNINAKPKKGTVALIGNKATYKPNSGYIGTDSFSFMVKDSEGLSSKAALVGVTVKMLNNIPIAKAQTVTVLEDKTLSITLIGTDADKDKLTYTLVDQPLNGTLGTLTNNKLTYSPNANYNGSDTFTFKVKDGKDFSSVAKVTIKITPVNDAPIATTQNPSVIKNGSLEITLMGTDADGDTLSYSIVTKPIKGKLGAVLGNKVTYKPNTNYKGSDSFTFKVKDAKSTSASAAKVNITVSNSQPIISNQEQPTAALVTPEAVKSTLPNPSLSIVFTDNALTALGAVGSEYEYITGNKGGSAVKFSGGSILIPNRAELQFTEGATFDMWARIDSNTGMDELGNSLADINWFMTPLAKSHANNGFSLVLAGQNTNENSAKGLGFSSFMTLDPSWACGASPKIINRNPGIPVGEWFRLTATASATSGTNTYVNKQLVYSCPDARPDFTVANTQDMYLGKFSDYWYPFNGAMQDMNVYQQALTVEQVKALP